MSDIKDVIAKVQKLLSLAGGNANENECKAAREAADRIIQAHRLTMAQIEAAGEIVSEPFVRKTVSEGGRRLGWQERILHALCAHYGGAFYFMSQRSGGVGGRGGGKGAKGTQAYVVLARESDWEVISYFYAYLCREVDRLARWHTGGEGIAASNAFRMGCAAGIAKQFDDLRAAMNAQAQAAGQSTALVLLSNRQGEATAELDRQVKLTKGAKVGAVSDIAHYYHGVAEGKKVQINQGLASGKATAKLGA